MPVFSVLANTTKRSIVFAAAGVAMLATSTGVAFAGPIEADSLINVRNFENPVDFEINSTNLVNFISNDTSVTSVLNSEFGSDIRSRGSLATGQTGTRYVKGSADVQNGQALISLFDTLTFDTLGNEPVNVSFGISLDGRISNSSSGVVDGGRANVSVSIFDITGLDTWIENFSEEGDADLRIGSDANRIVFESINFAVGTQGLIDAVSPFTDEGIVDESGTVFSFDLTKSGSFEVDPTKEYGIQISAASSSFGGDVTSDFFNTSTFNFTDLNGATFDSGSGSFLTASNTPVPEPGTLALFGIGIAGLFLARRRKIA